MKMNSCSVSGKEQQPRWEHWFCDTGNGYIYQRIATRVVLRTFLKAFQLAELLRKCPQVFFFWISASIFSGISPANSSGIYPVIPPKISLRILPRHSPRIPLRISSTISPRILPAIPLEIPQVLRNFLMDFSWNSSKNFFEDFSRSSFENSTSNFGRSSPAISPEIPLEIS